jgi:hypothetical protein
MTIRIIPYSVSYETVEKLNKYADVLLYFSTAMSIIITLLGYFGLQPGLKTALIVINIIFICLYVFLDNRANYIFTKAEMKRRLDWLDNSFGTNFSGKRSQGYFTNEHLSPGLYKLAVNCFENSFHSQFVLSKMTTGILVRTILIVLIFISSSYFGNREIFRMFFELSLPAILIQKMARVLYFSSRMCDVQDKLKSLFNDLLQLGFENKTAEALRDILEYETALSWASTPLSSKVFFKYKDQLATEWEQMKVEYKIQ